MLSWIKNELLAPAGPPPAAAWAGARTNRVLPGVVFGLISLGLYLLTGLLTGYVRSDPGLLPRLGGTLLTLLLLLCRELLRGVLLALARRSKGRGWFFFLIVVGFALPGLATKGLSAGAELGLLQPLLETVLPALALSWLYTSLFLHGGLFAPLAFGLFTLVLPQLLPVLPGRVRLSRLALDFLLPIFYLLANDILGQEEKPAAQAATVAAEDDEPTEKGKRRLSPWRFGLFGLVFGVLVLFFAGLLPLKPVVIATGSMVPTLQVGDVALVVPCDPADLATGDVIRYAYRGVSVIHRVAAVSREETGLTFVTRGDANHGPDRDPVSADQVLGRLVSVIPGLGRIALWLHADGPVYTRPSLWE